MTAHRNRAGLPDYWLERPPLQLDSATRSAVSDLAARMASHAADGPLDIGAVLAGRQVALWKVLCGLADRHPIAFHGTGDPAIERFEPRQPVDLAPFGQQQAVFATSDPIWAMFYAVVDRDRHPITLCNACIVLLDDGGRPGPPSYVFSISRSALEHDPWRSGHLYLLPTDTFVEQPSATYAGRPARVPQLASPVAVAPLARLAIAPADFPFLGAVRGHDDDRLAEYADALMAAAPWPD